jgi:hypothetical protein
MVEQPNREIVSRNDESLSHVLGRHAHKNEQIARQLSREAMNQWEKAINGALALPAAVALSTAANTLLVAAFIERGFEALQASAEAVTHEIESQMRGHSKSGNGEWGAKPQNERAG